MTNELQPHSDEQLARLAQRGDWASFDELVRRFEARIYGFVLNCCGHEADARELTQEAFVGAYQHLGKFDPSRSFATWLFTIARRKCIDRRRGAWRMVESDVPELTDADDPSVLVARREAADGLWRTARRVLSEAQFQTVWLHYAEDLAVRDVARVMRRTQTHVKVTLFRARKVLARELEHRAATEETLPRGDRAARPADSRSNPSLTPPTASQSL